MKSTGSLFLTKSRHDIWYYQRWIPIHFRKNNPALKKKFKVSLQTCKKLKAIQLSRLLTVKFDKLALQRFDNPKEFGKAMELLHQSAKAWKDYPDYLLYEENFLSQLGGNSDDEFTVEEYLLGKGEEFSDSVSKRFEKLKKAKTILEEILTSVNLNNSTIDRDELVEAIEVAINPPLSDEDNPTLISLFDKWCEDKLVDMQPSSVDAYKPITSLFVRFVTDVKGKELRINELDVSQIRKFRIFLENLPKKTQTKNVAISKLIELSSLSTVKMSKTTRKGKLDNIGSFLKWITSKGYPIKANLHDVLTDFEKIKRKEKQQRVSFDDKDIQKLFESDKYTESGKFKTSGMYWIPLIALYTGCRMSEMLQLECQDITQDKATGIWMFSINDFEYLSSDSQKKVKHETSSVRKIPIHEALIKLGFIDYVNKRKERLFPDEKRNTKGKFDSFQKRFATYLKQVDVKPTHKMEKRDFHSFRHTVRSKLTEIRGIGNPSGRFDEGIIDAILGHSSTGRSIGETTYNHSQQIEAKSNALNRLQYDCINLDKLKRWDTCNFGRVMNRRLVKQSNPRK